MTAERAGPAPTAAGPELDRIADQLTIGICTEAFAAYGITSQALDLAAEAVLATDAIGGSAESMLRSGGEH